MNENSKDTLKSLLTKLSAVRVTLTDEEQSLMDRLILSSKEEVQANFRIMSNPDEVNAMRLQTKPDERLQTAADEVNAMRLQTKPDERLQTAADEVNAMRLQTKPDERLQTAADEVKSQARWFYLPSEIKAEDTDEVSAHSMPASLLNKPGFANPVWVRIVYDPEMECYQVI